MKLIQSGLLGEIIRPFEINFEIFIHSPLGAVEVLLRVRTGGNLINKNRKLPVDWSTDELHEFHTHNKN